MNITSEILHGFSRHSRPNSGTDGFTLTELLVVIATLGILAVLVVPALAASHSNSHAFQCLSNMKRLQMASQLYANDNSDYLPGTLPTGSQGYYPGSGTPPAGVYPSWVAGTMSWGTVPPEDGLMGDSPAGCSTNASILGVYGNTVSGPAGVAGTLIGSIGGYVKEAGAYKCPADKTIDAGYHVPRVRDCSANCFVGVNANWVAFYSGTAEAWLNPAYQRFSKYSDFGPNLSAAQCFVYLEENPLSCNDGFFLYPPNVGSNNNDLPAANHGNSSSFSFADGHAELHKWSDTVLAVNQSTQNSIDEAWIATHGTRPLVNGN